VHSRCTGSAPVTWEVRAQHLEAAAVEIVQLWTGRSANALRQALRQTNEAMAQHLGTAVRTIAKWNAEPDLVPVTEMQRVLDTALFQASEEDQARFAYFMAQGPDAEDSTAQPARVHTRQIRESASPFAASAELRLCHDPVVAEALDWLDERAGWREGEAETRARMHLQDFDIQQLRNRARKRNRVPRDAIARTLARYYDVSASGWSTYGARFGTRSIRTSVITRPGWLDLGVVLGSGNDRLELDADNAPSEAGLDEVAASAGAARLAATLATNTRLVNKPLYQLRTINIARGRIGGTVSLTDFMSYALTMDLLETETLDHIAAGNQDKPTLPLRQLFLPTVDAVTSIRARLCAGGPLALFAAARPGSRFRRDEPDYVLLVQQRSDRVLNAASRLAVIPKSFHEPLMDFSDDAQISATLEREMEEELFGRADVDTTERERRHGDPFHLSRLSEPMRWLVDHSGPEYWRMECTGFGFNLVSGNFEFAALVVIEDEEWWRRFGGHIEANWETEGLRRYSSLDRDGLTRLVHDGSWSNEGLFALLQGLRRLRKTGGKRVSLPPMKLET
jgi:hypothetical protein